MVSQWEHKYIQGLGNKKVRLITPEEHDASYDKNLCLICSKSWSPNHYCPQSPWIHMIYVKIDDNSYEDSNGGRVEIYPLDEMDKLSEEEFQENVVYGELTSLTEIETEELHNVVEETIDVDARISSINSSLSIRIDEDLAKTLVEIENKNGSGMAKLENQWKDEAFYVRTYEENEGISSNVETLQSDYNTDVILKNHHDAYEVGAIIQQDRLYEEEDVVLFEEVATSTHIDEHTHQLEVSLQGNATSNSSNSWMSLSASTNDQPFEGNECLSSNSKALQHDHCIVYGVITCNKDTNVGSAHVDDDKMKIENTMNTKEHSAQNFAQEMNIILLNPEQIHWFHDKISSLSGEGEFILFEYKEIDVEHIENMLIQNGFKARGFHSDYRLEVMVQVLQSFNNLDPACGELKQFSGELEIMTKLMQVNIYILKRASELCIERESLKERITCQPHLLPLYTSTFQVDDSYFSSPFIRNNMISGDDEKGPGAAEKAKIRSESSYGQDGLIIVFKEERNFECDLEELALNLYKDLHLKNPEAVPTIVGSIRKQLYELGIENIIPVNEFRIGKRGKQGSNFSAISKSYGRSLSLVNSNKGNVIRKRKEGHLYEIMSKLKPKGDYESFPQFFYTFEFQIYSQENSFEQFGDDKYKNIFLTKQAIFLSIPNTSLLSSSCKVAEINSIPYKYIEVNFFKLEVDNCEQEVYKVLGKITFIIWGWYYKDFFERGWNITSWGLDRRVENSMGTWRI